MPFAEFVMTFHFFYQCRISFEFWQSLSLWLTNNSDTVTLPRQLEATDFLFGIRESNDNAHRLNFILLLGRFYIYRQKLFHQGHLDTYAFLVELKHTLTIERMAALKENLYLKSFWCGRSFIMSYRILLNFTAFEIPIMYNLFLGGQYTMNLELFTK